MALTLNIKFCEKNAQCSVEATYKYKEACNCEALLVFQQNWADLYHDSGQTSIKSRHKLSKDTVSCAPFGKQDVQYLGNIYLVS